MKSYSIIIPIYNEIKSIPQLLNDLKYFSYNNEIIIVNDGSNDGSKKILERCNFIKLINIDINKGKGVAISLGLDSSKNKRVIIYDGDLELKTSEIKKLMILDRNKKINFVLGSRFEKPQHFSSLWNLGNFLMTKLFNLTYKSNINDALCCSKSFFKSDIPTKQIVSKRFDIDVELTSLLIQTKNKHSVVPLSYSRRSKGEGKKIRYRDVFIIVFRILITKRNIFKDYKTVL